MDHSASVVKAPEGLKVCWGWPSLSTKVMWNPFKSLPADPSEPPPDPSNPPLQYLMIQGGRQRGLLALEPPKVPVDLLVLDENQGLELEPYPAWSTRPPPEIHEEMILSWPVRSEPLTFRRFSDED